MVYTVRDTATDGALQEILQKESVGDLITNLFPEETPLHQTLEKVGMSSLSHEEPMDTLGNVLRVSTAFNASSHFATTLAKPEGYTGYTDYTSVYPAKRISVVGEIQGLRFSVSDTNRAISQYGISDRFAYEALKATKAIVQNQEFALWWSTGTTVAGSDLNSGLDAEFQIARQTLGLVHVIGNSGLWRSKTGGAFVDAAGNNIQSLGTNYASWAYDANGAVLDQAMFKDQLMAQWYSISGIQSGAMGFCGAKIKNLFSQFALTANGPINERTLDAAAKRVVDTVDYYETDFGVVSLNLCRYLNIAGQSDTVNWETGSTITVPYDEVLLFIKPQYFKIGVVRPVSMAALGKTGDRESGLVRGEQGLVCRHQMGGAAIFNCIP